MIQSINFYQTKKRLYPAKTLKVIPPAFSGEQSSRVDLSINSELAKDTIEGTFNNKKIKMELLSYTPIKREMIGEIGGKPFHIELNRHKMWGTFDGQNIDIDIKRKSEYSSEETFLGKIGDKNVNLLSKEGTFMHNNISGLYNDKELNVIMGIGVGNTAITGNYGNKNINLNFNSKGFFTKNMELKGDFDAPDELFILLLGHRMNCNEKLSEAGRVRRTRC